MTISYKQTPINSTNVRFNINPGQRLVQLFFSVLWFLSSALSQAVILRLFFRPPSYTVSKDQKKILSTAKISFFESDKKKLKIYQWGKGPAVVFVHGWAGSGIQFSKFVPYLTQAGFSVWTFDHVGHGGSQGKTANYFKFSNAVANFFDSRPQVDVHAIVAHSLGGSAVINYLWRSKRKIKTILIAPALDLVKTLRVTFKRYGVPSAAFDAVIKQIELSTGHGFEMENPMALMPRIDQDILLVHDTKDRAVSYDESWKASLLCRNTSLLSTHGLGHMRILEDQSLITLLVGRIKSDSHTGY